MNFIENFKASVASEKLVERLFKKQNKIKRINSIQRDNINTIASIIFSNEPLENWLNEDIISNYVKKPFDTDLDRVGKIMEIAASHQIYPKMASILFVSEIEEQE